MQPSDPLNYSFDKANYNHSEPPFPPFPSFIDKKDKEKGLSIPYPLLIDISILKQDIVYKQGIGGDHLNYHLFFAQGFLKLTLEWGNTDYLNEMTEQMKVKELKKLKKESFLGWGKSKGYSLRVIKMIAQSIVVSDLNRCKDHEIIILGRNLNFINQCINNFLNNGNVCRDLVIPMTRVKEQLRVRKMLEEDSYLTPLLKPNR